MARLLVTTATMRSQNAKLMKQSKTIAGITSRVMVTFGSRSMNTLMARIATYAAA